MGIGSQSAGFGISIQGDKQVIAALKALEPKVARKVLSQVLRKGAKQVLGIAKELTPYDTGDLEESLKVRAGKRKKGTVRFEVGTGAKWFTGPVFYAGFVAFGTVKQPAQNFMSHAYAECAETVAASMAAEIKAGIEREAGK